MNTGVRAARTNAKGCPEATAAYRSMARIGTTKWAGGDSGRGICPQIGFGRMGSNDLSREITKLFSQSRIFGFIWAYGGAVLYAPTGK